MRLDDDGRRVGAVPVGELGAHLLDELERLRVAALRGEHADEQRDGGLVGRRPGDEAVQVGAVERARARQRRLRAQRRDLGEQPGDRPVVQVRDVGEQGPGLVGQPLGRRSRARRAAPPAACATQVAHVRGVDVQVVGRQPVAPGAPTTGRPVRRSRETRAWIAPASSCGGSPSQTASTSAPTETARPRASTSSRSTAASRSPRTGRPSTASSPRVVICTGPASLTAREARADGRAEASRPWRLPARHVAAYSRTPSWSGHAGAAACADRIGRAGLAGNSGDEFCGRRWGRPACRCGRRCG